MKITLKMYQKHLTLEEARIKMVYQYFVDEYHYKAVYSVLLEKIAAFLLTHTLTPKEVSCWLMAIRDIDLLNSRAVEKISYDPEPLDYSGIEVVCLTLAEKALNNAEQENPKPTAKKPACLTKRDSNRLYQYLKEVRISFIMEVSNALSIKNQHIAILENVLGQYGAKEILLNDLRGWVEKWTLQNTQALKGSHEEVKRYRKELGLNDLVCSVREEAVAVCDEIALFLQAKERVRKKA